MACSHNHDCKYDQNDFSHAYVTYLGHIVGHGQVRPRDAKVEYILEFQC